MYLGPERCISVSSNCPGTWIYVEREDPRVYMSSIWTLQCSSHIHKTPLPSHGSSVEAETAIDNLPGRPPDYGSVQGRLAAPDGDDNPAAGVVRVYNKQEKSQMNPSQQI